mmetsp:Transcript_23639/g.39534  ORF Transcript_23639/g.39534 Transcript_23639/m.39534 type:complete len:357 (-) Transcript_23639:1503-2573(-)
MSIIDTNLIKREFVAGGMAGAMGIFVGFPFDLLKVKMQTNPKDYPTAFAGLRRVLNTDGYAGLYKGCLPPILMQGLINSLIFTGESVASRILEPHKEPGVPSSQINSFLAGSAGGLLQCVVLVPSEVLKCTMQADESAAAAKVAGGNTTSASGAFQQTWEASGKIYRSDGIRGFYRGFGVTALREIPSIGVYFFSYNNIRNFITARVEGRDPTQPHVRPSTPAIMVAGALAGALAWGLLYPIDVIKTNMQAASLAPIVTTGTSTGSTSSSVGINSTHSRVAKATMRSATAATTTTVSTTAAVVPIQDMMLWQAGWHLYQTRGSQVFYRGVGIAIARALPANAVIFYVYENLKQYIG